MAHMRSDDRLPGRLQATFLPAEDLVPEVGSRSTGPATGTGLTPADTPRMALWGTDDPAASAGHLGLAGEPGELTTVLPRTARATKRVVFAVVPARIVSLLPAVRALVTLDLGAVPAWHAPGPSLVSWRDAAMLACELAATGHVVPALRVDRAPDAADPPDDTDRAATRAIAHWRAAPGGDARVARIAAGMPVAAHAVRRDADRVWTARHLLTAFLDEVVDALVRESPPADAPPRTAFGRALTSADPVLRDAATTAPPALLSSDLAAWAVPVVAGTTPSARLCVRLSTPAPAPPGGGDRPASHSTIPDPDIPDPDIPDPMSHDATADATADAATDPSHGRSPDDRWPLDYLLQATHDPSLLVDAADVWATIGTGIADTHLPDAQDALVRGLAEAARLFPPIDASLADARPTSLDLTADQAAALLTEGAGALTAAGLGVQLPAELTRDGQARLRARMRVGTSTATPGGGPAGFSIDDLGAFAWEVAIEGEPLSADEFAELARHKRSLVRWRGRWVHVDPDQLDQLAAAIGADGRLEPAAAMAALLDGEVVDDVLGPVEVVADDRATALLARLAGTDPPPPRIVGIDADLRPYQHRGVAWLQARADLGLGAVLADDMGLGKTLQSIVLVAGRDGARPHLVVCPASVVGNWEREIARFAPDLDVVRHHGPSRPDQVDGFPPGGITVTTYGTLRSDADLLTSVDWDVVVLDEAQAFKNHTTRTARVVRALPAGVKVAMTGTPVENRLAELWAIMDVAVPGLLGPFTPFSRELARPIERWGDRDATARLRRLTAPFVLRRTKKDPTIAADLPRKQEMTVPVSLTAEQASLYQAVVDETFADDLGEGIERRGRVLKLLTALKQVCNHPAQYLGQSGPLAGRSAKLVRATELLAEVVDNGDRALVFTQYRRMGDLLARHLADQLDLPEVPFLHGATTLKRRDELVEAFQHDDTASPLLLVSLKAGGTGLNLTRATHVVHYDRWWNPAVEDQATDRAYRIGQHRTVFVHKMTAVGTLEERIAEMLERKRDLADAVVGTGEAWLTELDDDALHELVTLQPGARDDGGDDVDGDEGEHAVAAGSRLGPSVGPGVGSGVGSGPGRDGTGG